MKGLPLFLLLFAFVMNACGGGDSATPTPTATSMPAGTALPTPTGLVLTVDPSALTEDDIRALLTLEDVEAVVTLSVQEVGIENLKESGQGDPTEVAAMQSWYALSFQTPDQTQFVQISVADYFAASSAQLRLTRALLEMQLFPTDRPIGDGSAYIQVQSGGVGDLIFLIKDDKAVQVLSSMAPGQGQSLIDLEGLLEVARTVAGRL